MALPDGLLFSLPYRQITDLKHSKKYDVQAKNPSERHMFGFTAIKLEEEIVYYVGWRPDSMKEHHADIGDYLVQAPGQPPVIVKSWRMLQSQYHIFRKSK